MFLKIYNRNNVNFHILRADAKVLSQKQKKNLEEKFNYVQETERRHEYIVREYNKLNEIRLLIQYMTIEFINDNC